VQAFWRRFGLPLELMWVREEGSLKEKVGDHIV